MKNLIFILIGAMLVVSCNKQVTNQMPPMDKELFNEAKDAEIATKKNPHGNPHNQPPPTVDTTPKKACIYLDFDGEVVSNTLWNTNGVISCNNSGLDITTQQSVAARVQQDYSFNSNIKIVTTESEYSLYPTDKRMRVIVTSTAWYGNVGGVAYVNSITWGDGTPCFVFSSLLSYNWKYIADASSHEAGHTFGNRHQSDYDESCNKTNEYSNGKIMGYPYYSNAVWATGTSSACCTCLQDDKNIINQTVNQ